MKTLKFVKMHGCGNDYIYFDCMEKEIENPGTLSISLSDRHFGIGGDGIVLICGSKIADAKMRMFNNDGSEGKMCGNAIRCVAKYLYDSEKVKKDSMTIETLSGIKNLELTVKDGTVDTVTVDMGRAVTSPGEIPVLLDGDRVVNRAVTIGGGAYNITCVSMGNPHCVVFCGNVDSLALSAIGPLFEKAPLFPERVNTEFVEIIDQNTIKMRVWERGSGETLACGTGACAAVTAAVLNGYCKKDDAVTVLLSGGQLTIKYTDDSVYMTGGATSVFTGEIDIEPFKVCRQDNSD